MSRPLRYIPAGGALVEVTLNVIQGRYLLRPDKRGRVNEVVLGVVGRAQRLFQMSLAGISVMSSHVLCAAAHKRCYAQLPIMWSRTARLLRDGLNPTGYST